MIGCPNCGHHFEQQNWKRRKYKCPKCGELFYGYLQLWNLNHSGKQGKKKLREAYEYLRKKPYFNRVYGYLESPVWGLRNKKEE